MCFGTLSVTLQDVPRPPNCSTVYVTGQLGILRVLAGQGTMVVRYGNNEC